MYLERAVHNYYKSLGIWSRAIIQIIHFAIKITLQYGTYCNWSIHDYANRIGMGIWNMLSMWISRCILKY